MSKEIKPKRAYKCTHRVQPLDRAVARRRYYVEQIKDELNSDRKYANVQDPASPIYGGIDPLRKWEMAAGGMVMEDRNAIANLSSEPVIVEYPASGFNSNQYIDDSVMDFGSNDG